MLEPVCTSLVELVDKVSSDKRKDLEREPGAVSLKHKEAIASAFSIPEAKGNKI
jgi:hypothetical protein